MNQDFYTFTSEKNNMNISIEKYKEDDCNAILEIINYNIINTTSLYDYSIRTIEKQQTLFQDKLAKGFPIIVAKENNKVLGFAYLGEFRPREANKFTVEHSVYVSHQHFGKGIGKKLLQELICIAKQQKFKTMIGVIDSENKTSIALHEKLGFKNKGTLQAIAHKFDRWLDADFLQLML